MKNLGQNRFQWSAGQKPDKEEEDEGLEVCQCREPLKELWLAGEDRGSAGRSLEGLWACSGGFSLL